MPRIHYNTLSRRSALQALYMADVMGITPDRAIDGGHVPAEASLDDYAKRLVYGVAGHISQIDADIARFSKNWAIDRMPVVDRAVLRLAIFEMYYVDEVPVSVSINEAVELAKEFGGEDDSHRFVNGVLGRCARVLSGQVSDGDDEACDGRDDAESFDSCATDAEAFSSTETPSDAEVSFDAQTPSDGVAEAAADASAE